MKYLCLLLLLSGCASELPKQVEVPIAVSCVTTVPTAPVLAYNPGIYTQVFPLVRDLKADRELMLGYQTQLEAIVGGCK